VSGPDDASSSTPAPGGSAGTDARFGAVAPRGDDTEAHAKTPAVSLPSGGGAVRGIGEKFVVNAANGTAALSVPLPFSPGRDGWTPHLNLHYDSGLGSGTFGLGWALDLPSVSRRTDKGLPRYDDHHESDVFVLSGSEDLVPQTDATGARIEAPRTVHGVDYLVRPYRPRVEGTYARIERWTAVGTGRSHWRTIGVDDVTTLYGYDEGSTVERGTDPRQVFTYLPSRRFDAHGHLTVYTYAADADDGLGAILHRAHERNRTPADRARQRYLRSVRYGNVAPWYPDRSTAGDEPALPDADGFHFELRLDYGEHDPDHPAPDDANPRACRPDPYSSGRAGFEVRTYRRCLRALMFHHFPAEPTCGPHRLVKALEFEYTDARTPPDPTAPVHSTLAAVREAGYAVDGAVRRLPPLELEYTRAVLDDTMRSLDADSLRNLPEGLGGAGHQWVDLRGDGLPGLLSREPGTGSWWFTPNLSPLTGIAAPGEPSPAITARLGTMQPVAALPPGGDHLRLMDVTGDGRLDAVTLDRALPGLSEPAGEGWQPWRAFPAMPTVAWNDPNLQLIDLTGDGTPDVLLGEDDAWVVYPGLGRDGFGHAQRAAVPWDEDEGARLVLADGTQTVHLADVTGDGLIDLVRVRDGEIAYWPNLGYGRFGRKVTMDDAPRFADAEAFDPARLRLADIDGSGTSDVLYLGADGVRVWFNQSGNAWSSPQLLAVFPTADLLSPVQVLDLLGIGTACLVWSTPLSPGGPGPLRYVDLMSGQKPHLLARTRNNLGAEVRLRYAPSTRFCLADRERGEPWVTTLPFPVQVVERVETYDWITRSRTVTRYAYHHGHYDGTEREFRGFARVDQWDTEEHRGDTAFPAAQNWDDTSWSPPVHTRSWYHTGAFVDGREISEALAHDYWQEPPTGGPDPAGDLAAGRLPAPVLSDGGAALTGDELAEAARSLRGRLLRQELYADDESPAALVPYRVEQVTYVVQCLQQRGGQRHGVFAGYRSQQLTAVYDRSADDPRVTHEVLLEVSEFGQPVRAVSVSYPRRPAHLDAEPALDPPTRQALRYDQSRLRLTVTRTDRTQLVPHDDRHHLPVISELRTWELTGLAPAAHRPGVTNLFTPAELDAAWAATDHDATTADYEDQPRSDVDAVGAPAATPTRRLIEHHRTLYRSDDLTGLLPLGTTGLTVLPGDQYRLAFTPGLLARGLGGRAGDAELTEGGYVRLDGHDGWWIPGGQSRFSAGDGDSPAVELAEARAHFYRVRRMLDAFGIRRDDYDPYDLLPVTAVDAVGNRHGARNDYRVLSAYEVSDPNGNRARVLFDALGHVVASAVSGKPGETLGDSLDGVVADPDPDVLVAHLADPLADPLSLLGNASTRLVYDSDAYLRTRDSAAPQPTVVWLIERETHVSDLVPGATTPVRHTLHYADAFGRDVQHKVNAGTGPLGDGAAESGPDVDGRWHASGWTVRDNKGRPIRRFEPFFSATPAFEPAVAAGVSVTALYDPLGRVVAVLHPDSSWSKTVHRPWSCAAYDQDDTAARVDPRTDPDVGNRFERVLGGGPYTSWVALRAGGTYGDTAADRAAAQDAAEKTAAFAGTPLVEHLDPQGRVCLVVHDLGAAGRHGERHVLDPEGEVLAVVDHAGRRAVEYLHREEQPDHSVRYVLGRDLAGRELLHHQMDSGARWMLVDVDGHPIRTWDERGFVTRTRYDAAHRPTHRWVTAPGQAEVLSSRSVYGEGLADRNLGGLLFRHYDAAGVSVNERCDFKGVLVDRSRTLARGYREDPDWTPIADLTDAAQLDAATGGLLQTERFEVRVLHDALARPVLAVTPHLAGQRAQAVLATFDERGLPERIHVWDDADPKPTALPDPGTSDWHAVESATYNARGERLDVVLGNGTVTRRRYDPLTWRIRRLTTTRPAGFAADERIVQDLYYQQDPVGNVTRIRDEADIHNVVFFRNRRVEPSADYTYDAAYRLVRATGREHLGQTGGALGAATQPGPRDAPRVGLLHPGDGLAMGTYVEQYDYDTSGNLLSMVHRVDSGGWTTRFDYAEPSTIEPGVTGNRLTASSLPGDPDAGPYSARYTYDAHGNSTSMPHLSAIEWDEQDQLRGSATQVVGAGTPETTYYVYDAGGQRVRKVTESAGAGGPARRIREQIYLGSLEVHREFAPDGETVTLERQMLLVVAERRPVATVERRTAGAGAPGRLVRYCYATHLPTCALELDENAAILSYEEYFPYGGTSYQAVRAVTDAPKRARWAGKERDEESGFYYHEARYYAPWLARWVSADPAGLIDGPNVYRFVSGNPISIIDPSGTVGAVIGGGALILWLGGEITVGSAITWGGAAVITGVGVTVIATDPNVHLPRPWELRGPMPAPGPTVPYPIPPPTVPPPPAEPAPPPAQPAPEPAPVPETPLLPVPPVAPPVPVPVPVPVPIPIPVPVAPPTAGPRTRRRTRSDPIPRGRTRVDPVPDTRTRRRRRRVQYRYVTYTKLNTRTGRIYVGRARGTTNQSPQAIVAGRDRTHHIRGSGWGAAVLDRYADGTLPLPDRWEDPAYQAIRGREQQIIDSQGGSIWEHGLRNTHSGNFIRGVRRDHPYGKTFHAAASARFGEIAPYTGN
jgi:RHS repeat-associated protein